MNIDEYFQTLTTFAPRQFQRETIAKLLHRQDILLRAPTGSGKTETAIAHSSFQARNPGKHLLAHTDYNPEDKQQWEALKAYEKKHKRPNHAIESAFLAQEILKQSLIPLLRYYFTNDAEEIKYLCYTVIMAAGRHHSAWASGWDNADVARVKNIELHAGATEAIADSWRSMKRFLPTTLSLAEANLSRKLYQLKEFDLNRFGNDEVEYLQLYLLVVRALRLCDQRSVQLPSRRIRI